MNLTSCARPGVLALLAVLCVPLSLNAANRCNPEVLAQFMAWCVDPGQQLSDYQKMGRDEIIEGRFCEKGGLVADGFLICQGHDAQAVALGYECARDQHMKAAVTVLQEDDPRQPTVCK